nr:hypothetical protein CFP56_13327 [Quercus suber]
MRQWQGNRCMKVQQRLGCFEEYILFDKTREDQKVLVTPEIQLKSGKVAKAFGAFFSWADAVVFLSTLLRNEYNMVKVYFSQAVCLPS